MMGTDIAITNVDDKEKALALYHQTMRDLGFEYGTRSTLKQRRFSGASTRSVPPRTRAERAAWAHHRLYNFDRRAENFFYVDVDGTVKGPFSGVLMHEQRQFLTKRTQIRYAPYGDSFFLLGDAYPESEVSFLSAPPPAVVGKRNGPSKSGLKRQRSGAGFV